MTQHGPFPGRPRGRRGRHDNDAPGWQRNDGTPAEQREFPDLSPIRPREARARDARVPDAGQGPWGQAPREQQAPWGPPGPGQPAQQGGYPGAPAGYQGGGPGGRARPQDGPQDYPRDQRARAAEPEEDIPQWAEPDSMEAFSERWHRRGLDSRDDQRAGRRRRRRVLFAAGAAVLVVLAVAGYLVVTRSRTANPNFGALITSFLPGELQSVPDACDTVPGATLKRYLPGTLKKASPPLNTGADTECTWTLDKPPTYRVLEVHLVAYAPSALYGNGSATAAAELAFESSSHDFAHPGPKSGQPAATVTSLSGMPGGKDTSALEATQVFHRNGAVTDIATVLVRYRNVIVTVVVDGLDRANGHKKYGPVAMSELTAAAKIAAREVAGKVVG